MRPLVLLLWPLLSAQTPQPLDFVHITDTHVARFDGVHKSLAFQRLQNAFATPALAGFLEKLKAQPPAFLLHTGDAIDAVCFAGIQESEVCGQMEHFREIMAKSPVPYYLALGNHDIERYLLAGTPPRATGDQSIAAAARKQWRAAAPALREGTYYAFQKESAGTAYRFLVLDNGETGPAGAAYLDEQIQWLEKQLAVPSKDWIVLVMHIPLGTDRFSAAVKAAAARNPRVILAVAGHRHTNAVEEVDLGPRRLTQVRTASLALSSSNWRRIRLLREKVEISPPGNAEAVELALLLPE